MNVLLLPYVSYPFIFNLFYEVCICLGGLMSGLSVGLLSIDMLDLEIKIAIGTEAEMN